MKILKNNLCSLSIHIAICIISLLLIQLTYPIPYQNRCLRIFAYFFIQISIWVIYYFAAKYLLHCTSKRECFLSALSVLLLTAVSYFVEFIVPFIGADPLDGVPDAFFESSILWYCLTGNFWGLDLIEEIFGCAETWLGLHTPYYINRIYEYTKFLSALSIIPYFVFVLGAFANKKRRENSSNSKL